jgi:hypothetical protein
MAMALRQYNSSPTHAHLMIAKGVLQYLTDTIHLGLTFPSTNPHLPQTIQAHASACGLLMLTGPQMNETEKAFLDIVFIFVTLSYPGWLGNKEQY